MSAAGLGWTFAPRGGVGVVRFDERTPCPHCPHGMSVHLTYNDDGLLTVRDDLAVLFVCADCDCRYEPNAEAPA